MKQVGELMKELGFKEEGSDATKKAFIENLVRAATGVRWPSSKQPVAPRKDEAPHNEEQLSFDFGSDHEESSAFFRRKSS